MLLQSLDIFEISGMVDNHHISIVPSAHTFGQGSEYAAIAYQLKHYKCKKELLIHE